MIKFSDLRVGQTVEVLHRPTGLENFPVQPNGRQYCPIDFEPDPEYMADYLWFPVQIVALEPYHLIKVTSHLWLSNVCWKIPFILNLIRLPAASPEVSLCTSCVECREVFIYPVEPNCAQGRVCYSCRSSYGWKYQMTGQGQKG